MTKIARSLGALSIAVAFGAGSAMLAPAAGAQSSLPIDGLSSSATSECGEQIVTPASQEANGWGTPDDENNAQIKAVDNAGTKIGDAALTFDTDDSGTSLYKNAKRVKLSELLLDDEGALVPISYDYFSDGQAPALQIRLHEASLHESESVASGHELGFATIVWSPADGDGTSWANAKPGDTDQYWVTRALEGTEGEKVARGTRMTLQEIINLNPDAVVTDYGIQKTRDNTSEGAAIDNFQLGCLTTNFELKEPAGGLGDIFGTLTSVFSS